MRKTIFILLALVGVLGVTSVSAQNKDEENKAALTFSALEHDFGSIDDKNKVIYNFEVINAGGAPLVITKAVVSCKCIDVDYPKKPIAPGARSSIGVTYNPRKQEGMFYKAIQIYSNDPAARHVITVKGNVVPQTSHKKLGKKQ